jgi:Fic family protein
MKPESFTNSSSGNCIRTPAGYWAFLPAPLPPDILWSDILVASLVKAERELGRLSALAGSFPFPRLLVQPFLRNEAVLSSRIEGTRASLDDLYKYETTQLSFFEKGNDVKEVFNYVKALEFGLERIYSLPISLRLFRKLHAILMEDMRGGMLTPGEFRRSQNWIGPAGSTLDSAPYVPPPVDEMKKALSFLEAFIQSDSDLPHLVRIALIHYQFEAIHPFLDGNGRIGRLLSVLLMCYWNLIPQPLLNISAFFEEFRQEYYDQMLSISQKGTWEDWLIFFFRGIADQADKGISRINCLREIRSKLQLFVETDRNPERMGAVVDQLFARPIFTIRQLELAVGIGYRNISVYVGKLEKAGIIHEITGYSRNRLYRADEIYKAIQEDE